MGLAVVGALVVLFSLSASAYGRGRTSKPRHTLLVTYVSAGAAVKGARLSVYGPSGQRLKLQMSRRAAKTDASGYVLLVLAGRPSAVRVVARGGTVKGLKVRGWLEATMRGPSLAHDIYVNPVSTVIDAYAASDPNRSLAGDRRKGRHLLDLKQGDSTGDALLSVTPYFNGLKFIRKARAYGSVQKYVKHLIEQRKQRSFQATGLPNVSQYLKYLGWAKDGISGAITAGNIAYDLFGIGIESKESKIYEAVQKIQKQLDEIQGSLRDIQADMQTGFDTLQQEVAKDTFAAVVQPVKELAGAVDAAQANLQDYVNNLLDPPATQTEFNAVADRKQKAIGIFMADIVKHFDIGNDVFRDALLLGAVNKSAAYPQLAQVELDTNGRFLTHQGSVELQYLASFVVQFQAEAFNLITRTETTSKGPSNVLLSAMQRYLGFNADQARAWVAANADTQEPSEPPSGDLHDELTLLNQIQPVPEGAAVEADTLQNAQGAMWQAKPTQIELGRTIYDRPPNTGMGCANQYAPPVQLLGQYMCQYMAKGWTTAQDDLTAAENGLQTSTSLGDWKPATLAVTQTLLKRPGLDKGLTIADDYWDPYDYTFRAHDYQVTPPGNKNLQAGLFAGTGNLTGYYSHWVSGINVTTVKGNPVASRGTKGTCWFGVAADKGSNCPALGVLLTRPTTGERYWP